MNRESRIENRESGMNAPDSQKMEEGCLLCGWMDEREQMSHRRNTKAETTNKAFFNIMKYYFLMYLLVSDLTKQRSLVIFVCASFQSYKSWSMSQATVQTGCCLPSNSHEIQLPKRKLNYFATCLIQCC